IPQLALRVNAAAGAQPSGTLPLEIQGTGKETRSFCFIDDLIAGVMIMREKGEHLGIYHVGTMEEVTIADLAHRIAGLYGREIALTPGKLAPGGTGRRCPDISKLAKLGYKPRVPLSEGLRPTLGWYRQNAERASKA
ncbi:MAG TPA: NAD-dependent dehydratase, partial [Pseudolabrys sp.]|nr:NAD-dependent dehydratase [Pseudolabrys sp.]